MTLDLQLAADRHAEIRRQLDQPAYRHAADHRAGAVAARRSRGRRWFTLGAGLRAAVRPRRSGAPAAAV
jgi:hypothetical protein